MIQYRFSHALFRQTLYEELSAPRRLRLQAVARTLEAQYGTRLEEHAVELAEHFSQSTDPEDLKKAVEYSELAARRAMAVNAYAEAGRLLEQALEVQEIIAPAPSAGSGQAAAKRCDLLLALGAALMPAGEAPRVFSDVAEEALALAEALGDGARAALACGLALEALQRYGRTIIQGALVFRQWAERADRHAEPGSRARILADGALSRLCVADGDWVEARTLAVHALELARGLGDPDLVFAATGPLLGPAYNPRHQGEQLRLVEELTAHPVTGVSTRFLAQVLVQGSGIYLRNGDRESAERLRRDLEQLAERTRDPSVSAEGLLTNEAVLDGDLEGALTQAARFVAQRDETGRSVAARQTAAITTFRPLIYLGRAEKLLEVARSGEEVAGLQQTRAATQAITALGLAHAGRTADARKEFGECMARMGLPSPASEAPENALALLLETAILLDDRAAVAALAEHLIGVVANHFGYVQPVARPLGAAAALLGDHRKARDEYARALEWATKIRHRPEIALTRLQLAELLFAHYPEERASAIEQLDFATKEFEAMKMAPSLERALALKAAAG